jgi:hypothetical protein
LSTGAVEYFLLFTKTERTGRFETMVASTHPTPQCLPAGLEEPFRLIRERAAALPFGTITLVIHQGRVTQMEVTEKRRFAP